MNFSKLSRTAFVIAFDVIVAPVMAVILPLSFSVFSHNSSSDNSLYCVWNHGSAFSLRDGSFLLKMFFNTQELTKLFGPEDYANQVLARCSKAGTPEDLRKMIQAK